MLPYDVLLTHEKQVELAVLAATVLHDSWCKRSTRVPFGRIVLWLKDETLVRPGDAALLGWTSCERAWARPMAYPCRVATATVTSSGTSANHARAIHMPATSSLSRENGRRRVAQSIGGVVGKNVLERLEERRHVRKRQRPSRRWWRRRDVVASWLW